MPDMIYFDLVSPAKRLASLEASAVVIPATDGDMTAMPGHAPFVTTLRPGLLEVRTAAETITYVVSGGLVEVSDKGISVLAEDAVSKADFTRARADARIAVAENALKLATSEEARIVARARIDDIKALAAHLGV